MADTFTSDVDAAVAQAVLAGRADAVVAADRDGIIVFWNPGAERIFGFTAAETVGRSLDITAHFEEMRALRRRLAQVARPVS